MSNLLKSKFLLGVLVVAAFAVVVGVNAPQAAAADCTITSTLRVGSKGEQVKCLQAAVGVTADGSFGPKTAAAVKVWQAAKGLVADGVFGAKSRAAFTGGSVVVLPAGCQAGWLFNPATGQSCTGQVVSQTGPVSAMLATDTPASGYIIGGQATADLMHFTLTGSGTVNTVTLQRTGVSDQDTLTNVYLFDGATRLTDGYSFNNAGTLTMNGLGLAVNGSRTIAVKADVKSGATASTIGVTLTSFTVLGGTPTTVSVKGNDMTYGTGTLATVYLNSNTSSSARSVNAGTSGYTVWSAPVQVNTRALLLKGANFRMTGSAPADALQNMKLYVDGIQVGSVATLGSINGTNYAMFNFMTSPVSLSTGTHTVELRADVVKGSGYKVTVSVQQASDLTVLDPQLGVNIASLGNGGGAFTANAAGEITINSGSASTIVDPTFQAMTNITGGATNIAIGKFKIHGYGEDVKVSTLPVKILLKSGTAGGCSTDTNGAQSAGTCGLNNVTLFFNGAQIGSSKTLASASMTTALEFTLGSQLIIPAGVDSYIEVRADLQTTGGVNYTAGSINAELQGLTSNAQGQTSQSTLSFPGTTGNNVTGNYLTIQTGVLAVAASGSYTAQTLGPNLQNAKIGSYILQNQSSSESVRVTSLLVGLYDNSDNAELNSTTTTPLITNFSNLKTSETSGNGATPVQPTASTTFSVDFTIAPGATKTIDVFADLGANAADAFYSKLTVTSLGSSSNVSISQNGNGTAVQGQVISLSSGTFGNGGVVVSSATAPQYVAAAGSGATNATKATYNFKSASGAATISELKFKVTTSTGSSVSSVTVNGVTAPVVSGVAYLTGLNISVPNGGSGVNVDAFMTYGPVGTNGNTSGAESYVEMTYIKYTLGGTTSTTVGGQASLASNTVLATKTASGASPAAAGSTASLVFSSTAKMQPGMVIVIDNTTDTVGVVQSITDATTAVVHTLYQGTADNAGTNVYFYSVPQNAAYASTVNSCSMTISVAGTTVAVGGTSGTDCMTIVGSRPTLGVVDASTLLVNGLIKVGSVTVAADAKGDVAINALPLTFNSTGNVTIASGTDNLVIKNAADQSTVNTTNDNLTVNAGGTDNTTVTFTGGYTVTAGQTVTFDVYATAATVTGGPAANALSMKLGAAASLTWTDLAGSGSAAGDRKSVV